MADRPGTWAGTALTDRRTARREVLLEAGVVALGAADARPLTVRGVCRDAGLTERHFYDAFGDRDSFVRAVYDNVSARAGGVLAAASEASPSGTRAARAPVEAFVDLMLDEPAVGRVLLLSPTTEPALGARGTARALEFVALVRSRLPPNARASDAELAALAIVGALSGLLMAYLSGAVDVDRAAFTEHCVDVVLSLGA
ncbi:TetR/AcrR family transcriptional regulator [Solicola gregarius]|uniref:HTH tetR-type domain-containing protein n=1 Tax=Solicola gregarius TaxID=2908642 RepID=A0AA46TIN3_9ACTN|nr:hypothetical protein [Solicola gregarius]UYM05552.1 hypothetical protein L0C25_00240 [Solicola gregarius]